MDGNDQPAGEDLLLPKTSWQILQIGCWCRPRGPILRSQRQLLTWQTNTHTNAQCTDRNYIICLSTTPLSHTSLLPSLYGSKHQNVRAEDIIKSNDFVGEETQSLPLERTKPLVVA